VSRLASRTPFERDVLLASILTALLVVDVFFNSHLRASEPVELLGALALGAALAFRRRSPWPSLLAFCAVLMAKGALLLSPADSVLTVLAVVFMAWTLGRERPPREATAGVVILVAAIAFVNAFDAQMIEDYFFTCLLFGLLPWLAGRTVRNRSELTRALAERAARLETRREEDAARAVQDERRRIARELHDVVAHSMSVMVIHAGAGRRLAEQDPDAAIACAERIERLGREALGEMRRLVGVMGDGDEPRDSRAPQPGLEDLDGLVARARAAGLPTELRIDGERRPLPTGADLAAYRIVQEALTNCLKHAGGAHARVAVTWSEEDVVLSVSDDGRGPGVPTPDDTGGGHGLVGMRERAALYGGEVVTGPAPNGGFVVRARIPLEPVAEAVGA
jgi:signal transduction histidine kinase